MKNKILLSVVALSTILTTMASADKSIGVTYENFDDLTGYGLNFNAGKNWTPSDNLKNLLIRADIDMDFTKLSDNIMYDNGDTTDSSSSSSYTFGYDMHLMVGYNLKDATGLPINVTTGVGIDFTTISSDAFFYGISYKGLVEYKITNTSGIRLSYRNANVKLKTAVGTSKDAINKGVTTLSYVWGF